MANDMNISSALNSYNAYIRKANGKEAEPQTKTEELSKQTTTTPVKLSDKAQALLDRLKEKYNNMDFMVADFSSDEEASSILSRGTKEYSVLFSVDELEKMAEDDDYAQKNIEKLESVVNLSADLNKQYGLDAALEEEGDSTVVTNVSVAFKNDGSMVFFATLEELSEKQKERIQAAKEKADQNAEDEKASKRTTVQASSYEELLKKIQSVDWSEVKESQIQSGSKIDYSV